MCSWIPRPIQINDWPSLIGDNVRHFRDSVNLLDWAELPFHDYIKIHPRDNYTWTDYYELKENFPNLSKDTELTLLSIIRLKNKWEMEWSKFLLEFQEQQLELLHPSLSLTGAEPWKIYDRATSIVYALRPFQELEQLIHSTSHQQISVNSNTSPQPNSKLPSICKCTPHIDNCHSQVSTPTVKTAMDLDFQCSCWAMEENPEYIALLDPQFNTQTNRQVLNNFSEVKVPMNWPTLITNCFTWESRVFHQSQEDLQQPTPKQLKLQWEMEWKLFCEKNLRPLAYFFKITIFYDIPWMLFNNIFMERFSLRPFQEVEQQATLDELELLSIDDQQPQGRRRGFKRRFPDIVPR